MIANLRPAWPVKRDPVSKKQSFFELGASCAMAIPSGASSLVKKGADGIMWSPLWLAARFLLLAVTWPDAGDCHTVRWPDAGDCQTVCRG